MKKILPAIVLALFCIGTAGWAAESDQRPPKEKMTKQFLASLNLTDAQKKDMANVKVETEKRAIELRAKAETSRLELRQLLMADVPDQGAIEKKMSELVKRETDIRMNKIDGWFAANKMLTPDQQKIWVKALRTGTMRAMKGRH